MITSFVLPSEIRPIPVPEFGNPFLGRSSSGGIWILDPGKRHFFAVPVVSRGISLVRCWLRHRRGEQLEGKQLRVSRKCLYLD